MLGSPRRVVIATVGTSVLTNLSAFAREPFEAALLSQPREDHAHLLAGRSAVERAAAALDRSRFREVGEALCCVPGLPRLLGAEIASLAALLDEAPYSTVRECHLLTSDSDSGSGAATALEPIVAGKLRLAVFGSVVAGLKEDSPSEFKVRGLRSLVHEIARRIREAGARGCVIDATGGFKAQAAIAVACGQAFGVPVVYRFESFPEVIEFPPLPFALDRSSIAPHCDLLAAERISREQLRSRFGPSLTEANEPFARFAVCLSPAADGTFEVSPMGQLALELLRQA